MGLLKFLFGDDEETIQLKNKVNKLNSLNSSLTSKVQEYESKISYLQQENSRLENKTNELQQENSRLENKTNELQQENSKLEKQALSLKRKIDIFCYLKKSNVNDYDDSFIELFAKLVYKNSTPIDLENIGYISFNGIDINQISNEFTEKMHILFPGVTIIDMSNTNMLKFPSWLLKMQNLFQINLHNNLGLKSIPSQISLMKKLKVLNISNTSIIDVEAIKSMKNLGIFFNDIFIPNYIYSNDSFSLDSVSDICDIMRDKEIDIKNLSDFLDFDTLDLSGIDIQTYPNTFLKNISIFFSNIKKLNISNTKLKKLPVEFMNFKNLEKLYLRNNRISSIPEEIKELKKLEILDISNNSFMSFPRAILGLKSIRRVISKDNSIEYPNPKTINFELVTESKESNKYTKSAKNNWGNTVEYSNPRD